MSNTFELKIITPTKVSFDDMAVHVQIPALDGYCGILANHAPLLTALGFGLLKINHPNKTESVYAIGGGFAEVLNNRVILITDFADHQTNIDVERAKKSMHRAVERLKERHSADVSRAEASLARARIRLIAAGQLNHGID